MKTKKYAPVITYTWPKVYPDDYGIRSAGKPDECFYCQKKVGDFHGLECVVVTRKLWLQATINLKEGTIVADFYTRGPAFWDNENIDYHYNDSSWCCNNLLEEYTVLSTTFESEEAARKALSDIRDKEDQCICWDTHITLLDKSVEIYHERPIKVCLR